MVYVIRNGNRFGPYTEQVLLEYVNKGQVLLCDKVCDATTGVETTVRDVLSAARLKPRIVSGGGIRAQISKIGSDLIFPKTTIQKNNWMNDRRMLLLSIVGLTPSVLMMFPISGFVVFYLVALYFSAIWGLFFYYFFRTPQVKVRTTMGVFFMTQIFMFVIWNMLGLAQLNPFYMFTDKVFPVNWVGYVLGVGLTEELVKAVPLLIIARRAKEPLIPQTLVYYGLMSGIGFGVFEGVEYQTTVNIELDYTSAFFMNIARLTSLPFLHAIWCGMAGYFISFAKLYPKYRRSLYLLAIAIPAILHGTYDTFCGTTPGMLIAVPVMALSVMLLITYLKNCVNYQSKLRA